MPVRKVTVIHDVSKVKDYLSNVLLPYADCINKKGITLDDCLNWIISEEIERVHGFIIDNHRRKTSPYVEFYYIVIAAVSNYALSRTINYSISLPRHFSKNNTISVSYTELDIIAVYDIEYTIIGNSF